MEDAKLIIHGLPADYTTKRLLGLFESFGRIVEGEFKWGIGFVGYADAECAEQAFTKMHESEAEGKKLKIDFPGRKVPVSRLIVKNLPTVEYSTADLAELFGSYGAISECFYMWGYGFVKYKAEESLVEATKSLKGTELAPGRKLFFEIQGPNGEIKSQETAARDHDDPDSIHSKIGPVRIFMGNLNEGTTEEEVLQVVEPLGEVKKIDLKANFGFIHFKEPNACREAHNVLSKKIINGANPRVQLAEIKKGGKVFVGGLNEDVNQEELIAAFVAYGPIVEYKFVRKFAFFTYDDPGDAKKAVATMNGKDVCDCRIKVAISSSDRAITGGDPDACHACGVPGHISRYCPADRKDVCHKCGVAGHWARDCPRTGAAGGNGRDRVRSRSPRRH